MSFNLRPGTSLFGNVTFTPGTNENYVAPPIHGTASGTTTTTVNYVLVGAHLDDDNGDGTGSVYVYDANDLTAQPTKLTAPDAADGDRFGISVTGVGDKIVVGASQVDVDGQQNAGAIYVYDANDLTAQPTKLTAYDADWADDFGYSVASYGDKILVGSRLDDDTKGNSGSVYVFDATDLTAQPTKLNAFDAGYGDQFGQAIAVSSNKIVVGAYRDDTSAGSAYVFDINDLSAQPTKLMPPDTAEDQMFANAVAISEDKIVIGAYGDDESNPSSTSADSGAAYVYDANDLTAEPTKLRPSDIALGDSFGKSVAIFDDKIVIGSFGDDDPTNSGSIYIYDANDLTAEPTKLTAPDAAAYRAFGGTLSYVGDTIVVSAYNSDDDGMTDNGAVYVYDASDLTAQPTKLTAPDAASYDNFGKSVAISYTTTTTTSSDSESSPEPAPAPSASWLVVGAYGDSNNNGYDGGAAYVYDINDLSAQPTKLIAFDGDETARFGNSSAATSDKIFIRSKSSGSVYVYDANNLTDQPTKITIETDLSSNTTNDDICVMGDKLFVSSFKSSEVRVYNVNDLSADPVILTPSASTEDDRFGWTMAVSDEKLVVSATRDDYNGILNSGAVYVYDINDLTSEPTKLRAFDGAAQDQLGSSVDVSADKIVVGASSDDDHGSASGSVYVFDANDLSAQPTKLTAFDAAQGDGFGVSVSINSDKIVVGATGDDDNGSTSGSAYVYDTNDLSAQPTKLTAFDGAASDYFGSPVLIVDDKIIVGAHRDDDNGTDSGSVYVYDANDLSAQPTKLTAFDGAADDYFGRSAAVG